MHLPSYKVIENADDYSEFKFISKGPKGDVVKLVIFKKYPLLNLYNLSLVDVISDTPKIISDSTFSNNNDLRMILATVVQILIEYTSIFPDRAIFFQGSDEEGRRRMLYHRAISEYYSMLEQYFYIEGITSEYAIEPFNSTGSYEAFLVKRK